MEKEKILIKQIQIEFDGLHEGLTKFYKQFEIWVNTYDCDYEVKKSNFLGNINLN